MLAKIIGSVLIVLTVMANLFCPALAFTPTATIGKGNIVKLEIASTPEQIERGLMYRTSLADGSGMVFLFNPPRAVRFWMYHTLIPLDMCFIDKGRIVKIFENVPPCRSEDPRGCVTYPETDPGIYVTEVVELPGGYAKKHGIKNGDKVTFALGK